MFGTGGKRDGEAVVTCLPTGLSETHAHPAVGVAHTNHLWSEKKHSAVGNDEAGISEGSGGLGLEQGREAVQLNECKTRG